MQNDIFKKWIYFAEQDLNFAKSGLKDKFYSHVCFLSQQTVEKACKAFLIYNNLNYPKTHKIVEIINSDKKLLDLLKEYIDEIKILDAFYIPTRYPDGIPIPRSPEVRVEDFLWAVVVQAVAGNEINS